MSVKRFLGACAFALVLGACVNAAGPSAPPAAPANGDPQEGQRLAEIYCARCHAIGAEGESPHPMAPPFRIIGRNYPVNTLEEAFAEGILVGHRDMPEFQLDPAQIDDLVAYLQSVQVQRGG